MKKYTRMTCLIGALVTLASCGEPLDPEQQRLLEEDRKNVVARADADILKNKANFVKACIAGLEESQDTPESLSVAPFSKTVDGGTAIYNGKWEGQHGYKLNTRYLTVTKTRCEFTILTKQGEPFYKQVPEPVVAQEFRKAGYSVTPFKTISGAAQAGATSLGALVPGPIIRVPNGSGSFEKAGKKYKVRVISLDRKSDHLNVGNLLIINGLSGG